ncbi:MAG TPA: hypothetical protein VN455_12895, partial [Methanotrichaceae archaeon]|nr:hypothetical protein [Methanotrichaceae archaeon]
SARSHRYFCTASSITVPTTMAGSEIGLRLWIAGQKEYPRGESVVDSWTLDASGEPVPISARSGPTVHLPDIRGTGRAAAHGGLFTRSDLFSHILVLLVSLLLMLLMLSCLPHI